MEGEEEQDVNINLSGFTVPPIHVHTYLLPVAIIGHCYIQCHVCLF